MEGWGSGVFDCYYYDKSCMCFSYCGGFCYLNGLLLCGKLFLNMCLNLGLY